MQHVIAEDRREIYTAAELTEAEWEALERAFATSIYAVVVTRMRRVKNAPQMAKDVLPPASVNQGHEPVNGILARARIELRFTRTEPWGSGEHRPNRKLAFVRWPATKVPRAAQLRLPLTGGSNGDES